MCGPAAGIEPSNRPRGVGVDPPMTLLRRFCDAAGGLGMSVLRRVVSDAPPIRDRHIEDAVGLTEPRIIGGDIGRLPRAGSPEVVGL
jgi:hypothetical protein